MKFKRFLSAAIKAATLLVAFSASPSQAIDYRGDFRFFVGGQAYEITAIPGSYSANASVLSTSVPFGNSTLAQRFGDSLTNAVQGGTFGPTGSVFDGFTFVYDSLYMFATGYRSSDNTVSGVGMTNNKGDSTGTFASGFPRFGADDTVYDHPTRTVNYDVVFLTAVAVPEINGSILAQLGLVAGGGYIAMRRRRKSAPAAA